MNIFFLLPFFAIAVFGIYNDAAALETITTQHHFDTDNGDGTRTFQTHHPYVFDGNNWVPYISSGTQVQTHMGTVTLNGTGYFQWNGKFNDSIKAKYADISDLTTWTYPNTLNNDTPDISWDGTQLVSEKEKLGVGNLKYKYIFNGAWKTQLEATNLSSLTTKVFGFDQIINLNSDTIRFGGVTRNLDNFHGQTFTKEFLDANKGKVLDLLNGINFDFDLGYENLYSITVYDTGANKSQLVFDYRTSEILLPGETLIIDPTFSSDNPTVDGYVNTANTSGASCSATAGTITTSGNFINPYLADSDINSTCQRGFVQWDISAIPDSADVTDVHFLYEVSISTSGKNCDINALTVQPSTATAQQLWDGIGSGTVLVNNDASCVTVATNYDKDLGALGETYIESQLVSDWAALGIKYDDETRDSTSAHDTGIATEEDVGATPPPTLVITYITDPPPDAIDDLTYDNLSTNSLDLLWTQPGLNGGTLQGYLINYTTPYGTPTTFLANTTNTYYNVTGLTFGTEYSFRVSAATEGGYNATGNILNVTTSSNTYSNPPVLTAFGPSSATTQINLEFPSSTMQNINGYRIQRETPIGTGWVTIVANTTTATQYYNNTGLSSNVIYNYRVYALNGTGISSASNTYDMTTFHLPDAVDDLTGSATDLSTIDLSWSAPTSYAPEIEGYMINGTTPTGEPVDILNANTGSSATTATALNLLIGQEYSFRVSPITVHGMNASGNIWNGSTIQTFVIGNLSNPDITNDDDFSIFFDRTDVNASAIQLDVTYPNSYNLSCDFAYKYARTNHTYSGLSTVPDGADDQTATFTLINATGDLVQVRCWDTLTGDESTYVITITDFPFLQQVNALRDGEYGTFFQIGAFDGVMLIVIFLGMIGLNRTTPIVGIIFVVITTLVMSYFELITYPVIMYPALIMMIVWAFVTTRKDD